MVKPTDSLIDTVLALESGEVGALELLDAHLERIDRLNPQVNAVVTLEPDRARAEAQAIDDARANGNPVGPLGGVPITIKDALATEGIRSTGGATELQDFVPEDDAAAVATVRDAGAIVFGKTNVPRWSGDYQSYNEMFGTTNNPWDLERTPGGSSGGTWRSGCDGLHDLRHRYRHRRFSSSAVIVLWRVRTQAELRHHPDLRLPGQRALPSQHR